MDRRPAKINRFCEGHGRITYLTVEQVNRLAECAKADGNPQIYPFIIIGLETAMRKSEILSIRREDIDLQRRVIFIPKAKAGHTVDVRKPFRRVVAAAGLDPDQILRHTLRHTAITHLVQAGVDLPTVKRISGHKTLAMVERYSHQNGTHIQAAMDKQQARLKLASWSSSPLSRWAWLAELSSFWILLWDVGVGTHSLEELVHALVALCFVRV